MTEPYKNIPHVLPGSQAAQAVDEINHFVATQSDLTPGVLEEAVKNKILEYGGDPVTAAAASRTAGVLAEQNPERASMIAENVVGATLADPSLANSRAADSVDARLKQLGKTDADLSDTEKSAIAFEEANTVLRQSGVTDTASSQALQQSIDQYIANGASASQAAAAAVAAVMAQAMPQANSFSIFGYFNMLVHQDVEYIFLNTETMKVTDSAIHTHLSTTTYEMDGKKLYIKATDIKTKGISEIVRAHPGAAFGKYDGSYFSWAPFSGSLYLWANQYGVQQHMLGVASAGVSGMRVYLSFYDSDLVKFSKGVPSERDERMTALEFCAFVREAYTSGKYFIK